MTMIKYTILLSFSNCAIRLKSYIYCANFIKKKYPINGRILSMEDMYEFLNTQPGGGAHQPYKLQIKTDTLTSNLSKHQTKTREQHLS
jgi:hypothetical protein